MTKYVVFAGRNGGNLVFNQAVGYLESLSDQGILDGRIVSGEIWKSENIELWFPGDERIKEVLAEMTLPERYMAIRAEVSDEDRLEEVAPLFCERYEMEDRVYEA